MSLIRKIKGLFGGNKDASAVEDLEASSPAPVDDVESEVVDEVVDDVEPADDVDDVEEVDDADEAEEEK